LCVCTKRVCVCDTELVCKAVRWLSHARLQRHFSSLYSYSLILLDWSWTDYKIIIYNLTKFDLVRHYWCKNQPKNEPTDGTSLFADIHFLIPWESQPDQSVFYLKGEGLGGQFISIVYIY